MARRYLLAWGAFVTVAVCGCGQGPKEGGPQIPGMGGGGGTSGSAGQGASGTGASGGSTASGGSGTSGGSGGTAGSSGTGGQGGTAAQGGTGGSGAAPSLPKCFALCDWEVQVAGDCPADATDQCHSAFKVGAYGKDATCVATMESWCDCLHQYADPNNISCTGGSVTSNIPVLNPAPSECNSLGDDWSKCNQ